MNEPKMLLMPGWLMITPPVLETKTKSGLTLPAGTIEQPLCGEVVLVGLQFATLDEANKVPKETPIIEVGDKVYFQKWGGMAMKIEGKLYMFLRYTDLVSVVKK